MLSKIIAIPRIISSAGTTINTFSGKFAQAVYTDRTEFTSFSRSIYAVGIATWISSPITRAS